MPGAAIADCQLLMYLAHSCMLRKRVDLVMGYVYDFWAETVYEVCWNDGFVRGCGSWDGYGRMG